MPTINFNRPLKTIDGLNNLQETVGRDENGKNVDVEFTLQRAAVQSLLLPNKLEEGRLDGRVPPSGKDKEIRFLLAERIAAASEPIKITSDDVVLLKTLIADAYGVLVVGQANRMLEAD